MSERHELERLEELTMIALALKNHGIEDCTPEEGVEKLIESTYLRRVNVTRSGFAPEDRERVLRIAEVIERTAYEDGDFFAQQSAKNEAAFLRNLASAPSGGREQGRVGEGENAEAVTLWRYVINGAPGQWNAVDQPGEMLLPGAEVETKRLLAASATQPLVEALEITLETLERCRRDESLTYEEKKAAEEYGRKALTAARAALSDHQGTGGADA
jgi:hypothetical protein